MKYINKVEKEFVKNFVEKQTKLLYKEIKVRKEEDKIIARCITKSDLIVKMTFTDFGVEESWCPEWVNGYWQGEMFKKFGVKYQQALKKHLLNNNQEKSFFD